MDAKVVAKVVKALSKMFRTSDDIVDLKDGYGVMDAANVLMIVPLCERARRWLALFASEESAREVPSLDVGELGDSQVSVEYLFGVVELFKACESESVKLSVRKDFPLIFENDFFKVIVAPRVED